MPAYINGLFILLGVIIWSKCILELSSISFNYNMAFLNPEVSRIGAFSE